MGKEISPITIDRLPECGNVAYQSLFFVHFRRLTLMSYLPIPSASHRRSVTFAAMLRAFRRRTRKSLQWLYGWAAFD
jgi:hypothetical protein